MGEAVAAILTTHVPRLMIADPGARRSYMGSRISTFYGAMKRLERDCTRGLEFDTYLLIDTHWVTTIEYVLNAHKNLAGLYTSDEVPAMLSGLRYSYRGDPGLAHAIVECAERRGLRSLASAHKGLPLHYGTLNVMHYLNPGARRRVLSIGVCQTASVRNDLGFGAALGEAIARSKRRVVIVASGGLSHRFWDYDHLLAHASASPEHIRSASNRRYDEKLMRWLRAGAHRSVIEAAADYRARCSPEGHFSHYLIMAGAMGGRAWNWRGAQFGEYESAIGTGQAVFFFSSGSLGGSAKHNGRRKTLMKKDTRSQ